VLAPAYAAETPEPIERIEIKYRMLKIGFSDVFASDIQESMRQAAKAQNEYRRYQLYSKLIAACDAFDEKNHRSATKIIIRHLLLLTGVPSLVIPTVVLVLPRHVISMTPVIQH